ncbi:MAG: O-antigen ligase family protein, partial [Candidatus Brocadiales bacterium]|nr:O-antigen ligase family protein [Candidatus Bathyanammoxibius sp.]
AAFRDNLVLGSGVGSHREVYPLYLNESLSTEYTHAESGYFQVASEMGTGGLVLLLAGIGLCASWCIHCLRYAESKRVLACLGATSAGLAASVLHSFVDFVWYIPACMSITTILIACTFRLSHFSQPEQSGEKTVAQVPRMVWLGLTTALIAMGCWMIHDRLGPALASPYWDEYLRMSRISTERQEKELRYADSKQEDAERESVAETVAMINQLEKVIEYNPTYVRAHLRMAGACLQYFDQLQQASANAMDLSQICDAAIASKFSSRAELDEWLSRSVGEDRKLLEKALWHTHRGLQLCPLQGEGYLYLANLCFLEGGRATSRRAYVDQALKVRPYDGGVLLQAGKVAILAGDVAQAMDYWKRCFQSGGIHQLQLIQLLAGHLPLTFVLDQFNPNLSDMQMLYLRYKRVSSAEELKQLSQRYVSRANSDLTREDGKKAARAWLFANRMDRDLGDTDRAIQSAQQAYAFAPGSYQVRYVLARSLLEAKQFSEAETHLRWCLGRKPRNQNLRSFMEAAVKGRIRGENQNMSASNANHPQSHR